jgi:hypothetical protein
MSPVDLVQIEKHLLLKFILAIVHCDGVVVLAETVSDSNERRLLDVTNI